MRSDSEIRQNVESELRWDPDIKSDDIAVAVDGGGVMLTGFVPSYGQRVRLRAMRSVGPAYGSSQ